MATRFSTRKKCQIGVDLGGGGYSADPEAWPEIQDPMVDAMAHLEAVFRAIIAGLPKMHAD